jgi:putative peptide-modifying radical SAM enzyme
MQEFDNGLGEKWDYDESTPFDSTIPLGKLKSFLKPDDTLIFYGGEPFVKSDRIKEIIDNVNCKFAIQTNGVLLKRLPINYIKKIDKMLISIDGDKARTDSNRGNGVYDLVIKNLRELRSSGYTGEIVARMTVSAPDLFEQVRYLADLIDQGIFSSIHWQIDAGFYKFDFDEEKFKKFVSMYNSSIDKLLRWWVEKIRDGKVYRLYPFIGILNRLAGRDFETGLPCGSGYRNFTFNTLGKLSACPIMNSVKNFYCGSIDEGIKKDIHVTDEKCTKCNYFKICGGRCLYWRDAKLWPPEGDEAICTTIKFLIGSISQHSKEIAKLEGEGVVRWEDFDYEKYFGPEIIP